MPVMRDGSQKVILLIGIMAIITVTTLFAALFILYNTSFEQSRQRLVETVKSQAHLIEAVARFDAQYSSGDVAGGSFAATLQQIIDAHSQNPSLSESFEFTLAKLEGDQIVFIQLDQQFHSESQRVVPYKSDFAEPMRIALSGESGSIIALDYKGNEVLAAYEPVKALGLGIVAKIDLREIRSPFITAGGYSAALALLLIIFGALLFNRISSPLLKQLQRSNREMEEKVAERTATLAVANEQLASDAVELGRLSRRNVSRVRLHKI